MSTAPRLGKPRAHALSVDVEDYFQVQVMAEAFPRSNWDSLPRRVEASTERLLDLFARAGQRGTFFTLGWVAERHPQLIRRIVNAGHELASHGYFHQQVHTLSPAEFRADLIRAKGLLEDAGGVAVIGYRAPTFSINPRTEWAYPILAETGHRYSSSLYPVKHDLYGAPHAPRFAHLVADGRLWEFPMTTVRRGGHNMPAAGGGYFRLLPYWLYRANLRRFAADDDAPGIFYIHPWEVDPGQPRVALPKRLSRFRHYVNLAQTEPRLERLLRDFSWERMDEAFAAELAQTDQAATAQGAEAALHH